MKNHLTKTLIITLGIISLIEAINQVSSNTYFNIFADHEVQWNNMKNKATKKRLLVKEGTLNDMFADKSETINSNKLKLGKILFRKYLIPKENVKNFETGANDSKHNDFNKNENNLRNYTGEYCACCEELTQLKFFLQEYEKQLKLNLKEYNLHLKRQRNKKKRMQLNHKKINVIKPKNYLILNKL